MGVVGIDADIKFGIAMFVGGIIYGIFVGMLIENWIFPCPDCVCKFPDIDLSCPEPEIPDCPPCVCPPCKKPKLPSFMQIAQNMVEEHKYDFDRYNCDDFSRELIRRLEDYGWEAKYCYGKVSWNDQYYHAWVLVEVPIEATSGKVIEPNRYAKDYHPLWCE